MPLSRLGTVGQFRDDLTNIIGQMLQDLCMKIQLTQGKKATVSKEDYTFINQFRWSYFRAGRSEYASTRINKKTVYMHRLIMVAQKGQEVDHKNNNGLDNRRTNLRICTSSQNKANQRLRVDNKTGYRGINFDKQTGKYRARISFNGKDYSLGRHKFLKDAVRARRAALTLHGEFAKIN